MQPNSLMKPPKRYFVFFLLPIFLLYAFAVLLPIVGASWYSLFEWSGGPKKTFVGADNYVRLLSDETFWLSLKNNLTIVLLSVIGQIGIALIIAAFLSSKMVRFARIHRTVIFFPVLLSAVVVGFTWSLMYNKDFGLINALLRSLGLENWIFPYLDDPDRVIYSLTAPLIWQFIGLYMVIISAGMTNVPTEVFEMGEIDGADGWRKMAYITLPLIKSTLMASLMMCIAGNMKVFSHISVMTNGGPGKSSMVMALYAYRRSFVMNEIGYGSAISIGILVISLGLIMITRLAFNRKENDE